MSTTNSTPPDMIAQAGALLAMIQQSSGWISADHDAGDDRAIVIASAVLAVAGELRDIRNVLADATEADDDPPASLYEQMRAEIDGLRQQLVKADADNAMLIAQLHPEATR